MDVGVLKAVDQRADVDYPMNLSEEQVCLHVLKSILTHELSANVLLDHDCCVVKLVCQGPVLAGQRLAEDRLT